MTFITHGATGAQGSPVVAALLRRGKRVTAAVRTPDGLPESVIAAAVDNADAAALTDLYRGAEGVFVHLPLDAPDRVSAQATAIVEAVSSARPPRVVVSTSGLVVDDSSSPIAAPAESPIRILIDGVVRADVSAAIVAPRLFLENLLNPLLSDAARTEGVLRYPVRDGFPVSWASHLDVAEVVAHLLVDTTVTGTVGVGHLPGLTGDDLAAGFAAHFGRDVTYEPIPPSAFGDMLAELAGPAAAASVSSLYAAIATGRDNTIDETTSAQRLLGLAPRSVTDWLAQIGA